MFGGLPDVPAVPAGLPEIPKVPELPKAPESAGPSELDTAIKQVDELQGKLAAAETKIYGMLKANIPKVTIALPKMSPSLFGGSAADDAESRAPLLPAAESGAGIPSAGPANTPAKKKAAEVKAKAQAAAAKAEEARLEMEDQAKQAMAAQTGMAKQFAGQGAAAAVSLTLAVGISQAQLGALAGPLSAAVVASVVNTIGLGMSWKSRAGGIFAVVNGVFDKMKGKVVDVLETCDDMIMGPLSALEGGIDDMLEEQKPVLEQMAKFESGIKKIDLSFNLPDPEDLKKPLDGCEAMIDDFVGKAKKEVPDKLEEIVQSTLPGRIATDASAFNNYIVYLPIAVVLAVNVSLALLQAYLTVTLMAQPEQGSTDSEGAAARSLRGAKVPDVHAAPGVHAVGGVTIPKMPKNFDMNQLQPYVQPALVQIVLSLLQMAFAAMMSQGPRICKSLNSAITDLQENLNTRVNGRIKGAVDKVFGVAFAEVKGKSDSFFPKMKDSTKKLLEAMQMAAKAQAAAGAVAGVAAGLGF